ncbi:MAG: methyltransferase domain-containing protein [Deltaproteobacteria bacterium]|nr:methyltransferase domain-containing protein [Deltaproteobacteria bacterium]
MLSGASGNLDVNRCKSCGFVYLASWEQSLAKSQELYDYYGRLSEADLTRRYSPENRARQQELLTALAGHTRGRRLLDVGCGDGQLLQTAKDEGWDAVGIDLAETAILLCHRRGLTASKTCAVSAAILETRRRTARCRRCPVPHDSELWLTRPADAGRDLVGDPSRAHRLLRTIDAEENCFRANETPRDQDRSQQHRAVHLRGLAAGSRCSNYR